MGAACVLWGFRRPGVGYVGSEATPQPRLPATARAGSLNTRYDSRYDFGLEPDERCKPCLDTNALLSRVFAGLLGIASTTCRAAHTLPFLPCRAGHLSVDCDLPRRRTPILVKVSGSPMCGRIHRSSMSIGYLFPEHGLDANRRSRNDANADLGRHSSVPKPRLPRRLASGPPCFLPNLCRLCLGEWWGFGRSSNPGHTGG